ncbi:MalM family protein [Vibrio sp. S4M6]|uniref:MalM family protein n=1 Tax=Vibrio sinus TaxID=2946865 RepID=UPI00202A7788|nr:MalM family protein [Vibrio sinus]MCL9780160.1 MalM family protein [Vibrio sinus]
MKTRLILLVGSLFLSGCVTTTVEESIPVSQRTSHSIFELQRTTLTVPSTATIEINQHTQYLKSGSIDSPVAAFNIPADSGALDIKISSAIKSSVFYPSAVIMNAQGNIIQSFNSSEFKYQPPDLDLSSHLVAEKTFQPPYGSGDVFLIVYTNPSAIDGYSKVINPKYVQANQQGLTLPKKYIQVPHSNEGIITVNVENASASVRQYQAQPQSMFDTQPRSVPVMSQSEYYRTAIEAAVTSNNVPKAVDLVKEAKAKNIEGIDQVFVDAIQKNTAASQ